MEYERMLMDAINFYHGKVTMHIVLHLPNP